MYGAERWILAQMRHLDPRRFRVSIVNLVDNPKERSAIVAEALRLGYDATDFYTGGRFNPFAFVRLAKVVRRRRFSILHSHGYKSDILGLIAGRVTGIKIMATPHGWSNESDSKLLLYEKIDRSCLKFFDHVCPVSGNLYESLRAAGLRTSKMTLIWNGTDIGEIDATPSRPRTTQKKRIGYMGQFIERKNLEDLVDAFFRLDRTDCELFLIGDGPCRKDIIRRIESRKGHASVYCPGYTTRRIEELKSLDVFILPSLMEGVPRCVMEAQAAGVPVVATDIAGTRELVVPGQTGLLVPPHNPEALADAINRILNSPKLAAKLSVAARQLVAERFSAKRMAAEYENVYSSLVDS